jgi:glutamate--cysteine ligase catalytic subunit
MLESTPGVPYGATLKDMLAVEPNMRWRSASQRDLDVACTDVINRRRIARQKLFSHEVPVTLTSFPRLGVKGVFLDPHHEPLGEASHSLFVPDQIINPHVRFPCVFAVASRRRDAHLPAGP